jgi:hypothetical protein
MLRCVLAGDRSRHIIHKVVCKASNMNIAKALCIGLGIAVFALPVDAHHSAAQFDFSKTVLIEGKVKVLDVRNPHIKLVLEVGDDAGVRDIEYEGHSRNNVYRRGWRPEQFGVGDDITIGIAPLRDGGDGGYITTFKLADGTEF